MKVLAFSILLIFTFQLTSAQTGTAQVLTPSSTHAISTNVDMPVLQGMPLDELSATTSVSVHQWIVAWQRITETKTALNTHIYALQHLFQEEDIGLFHMVALVRTISYVDGPKSVEPLTDVVLFRAKEELSKFVPPDPTPKSMIEALWPLHDAIWDDQDFGQSDRHRQDQQLLELLRPWEKRGSGHSQWATYVYAENLYMQQKWRDAYAAFQDVLEERKVAFEPSQGSNRGIDWELGLCLYFSGQFAEAAPHFREMANNKGVPEGPLSWPLAVAAFAKAGDVQAADKTLDEWIADRKPSVADVAPVLRLVEKAKSHDTSSDDFYRGPTTRAVAEKVGQMVADMKSKLAANPRSGMVPIYKDRSLDELIKLGANDAAAELAMMCIHGQPDQLDRTEYFLLARTQALLAGKRYQEALGAAKSYYNTCHFKTTPKAIELIAQCLTAAHPDDPGKARRFKFQQLADREEDREFGDPILKTIHVDEKLYNGAGLTGQRSGGDWQWFGQANVLLMQDHPEKARPIFERLLNVDNVGLHAASIEGIARTIRAEKGLIAPANAYLLADQQPTTKPAGQ